MQAVLKSGSGRPATAADRPGGWITVRVGCARLVAVLASRPEAVCALALSVAAADAQLPGLDQCGRVCCEDEAAVTGRPVRSGKPATVRPVVKSAETLWRSTRPQALSGGAAEGSWRLAGANAPQACSMPEMPDPGKDHGEAGFVCSGDHVFVPDRAAGLDDGGGAG